MIKIKFPRYSGTQNLVRTAVLIKWSLFFMPDAELNFSYVYVLIERKVRRFSQHLEWIEVDDWVIEQEGVS